jgi:hypothetical protein
MPAKPKTCGQCAHTEPGGAKVVWCFGAPPAVIAAAPNEAGGLEVKIQANPLLSIERRACAVFKPKPRGGAGDHLP